MFKQKPEVLLALPAAFGLTLYQLSYQLNLETQTQQIYAN